MSFAQPRYCLMLAVLAALMLALERWQPVAALWAFVALTAATGMLHGAADVWLMREPAHRFNLSLMRSLALYAALSLLLMTVLLPFPGIALLALLAMSVVHFAQAAAHERPLSVAMACGIGGAPIAAPWFVAHAPLQGILTEHLALAGWQLVAVNWGWQLLAWLTLGATLWAVIKPSPRHTLSDWLELAAPWALNALLSPLAAFALFFGVHHSGGHLLKVWASRAASVWSLMGAWLLAMGIWAGLAAHAAAGGLDHASSWLQTAIVALAALTLPHAVVVRQWQAALAPTPVSPTPPSAPNRP